MSDQNFETIVSGQLRQYSQAGVRPIDRYAVAQAAIATGRATGRGRWSLGLGRRAWLPILVGLLLLALAASAIIAGVHPRGQDRTHSLLAVSGDPLSGSTGPPPAIDVRCLTLDTLDVDTSAVRRGPDCADRLLVSPDGSRAAQRDGDGLTITDLRTAARTTIADTLGAFPSAWSPGGRWLQWVTCPSVSAPCDAVIGAPDASTRNHLPFPIAGGYNGSFLWSPDDRRFVIREDSGMYVGNGDGSEIGPAAFDYPVWAWSPDAGRIAYGAGTNPFPGGGARATDVYLAAADGSAPQDLTEFDSEVAYGASWSPDGRILAVVSSSPRRAGSTSVDPAQLWVVDTAGHRNVVRLPTELTDSQARDWSAEIRWSPDGSRFALQSAAGTSSSPVDVLIVPVNGSGVVVVHDAQQPTWSSDSATLAVVGGRGSAATIDVLHADGSGRRSVGTLPNGLLSQLLWAR